VENDPSLDGSRRELLRARFVGHPEWVEIGTDLPPSVVAASSAA
jgi:hypothetical protein